MDDSRPVVALSFHADVHVCPETRWTFPHYKEVITDLAKRQDELPFRLLGHCHPRMFAHMHGIYRRLHIEFEPDWLKVLERADLYVCDNSSSLYEFAAIGKPVVVLSAPWYRRDVEHGIRFWTKIPGIHVEEPEYLRSGIEEALLDSAEMRLHRERIVSDVYSGFVDGRTTERATLAIRSLTETLVGAGS